MASGNDASHPPDKPPAAKPTPDPREDRLAKALRANLRRRKAGGGPQGEVDDGPSET